MNNHLIYQNFSKILHQLLLELFFQDIKTQVLGFKMM